MMNARVKATLLLSILAGPAFGSIDYATSPSFTQGFPFDLDSNLEYEQVYSAQVFENSVSGPVLITGVTFFDQLDINSMGVGSVGFTAADFEIEFYTTTLALTSPDANLADRALAPDFIGGYPVQTLCCGIGTTSYTFTGPAFVYDPSQGNLVMDVIVDNVTATGSGGFDLDTTDPNTQRIVNLSGLGGTGSVFGGGLETSFQIAPEPRAVFLLAVGLAALAARRGLRCFLQRS